MGTPTQPPPRRAGPTDVLGPHSVLTQEVRRGVSTGTSEKSSLSASQAVRVVGYIDCPGQPVPLASAIAMARAEFDAGRTIRA